MDTENIGSVNTSDAAAPTENTDGVNSGLADRTGVETGTADPKTELSDSDFEKYLSEIIDGKARPDEPTGAEEEPEGKEPEDEEASKDGAENPESAPKEDEPFKTFATEKEYQAEIDRIFSKRHKDYKETERKLSQFQDTLKKFYKMNIDDAVAAFEAQTLEQVAQENGLSKEEAKERIDVERKAKAYDDEKAEREAVEAVRKRLTDEESAIKEFDPNFDMSKMYEENDGFRKILTETGSVYKSYLACKKQAFEAAKQKKQSQPSKQQRTFRETGSMKKASAGKVETDASKLSDKDFEAYIRKIKDEF